MAADSFIFGGNTGLTYEELKRRRAIAQAIASRQRGYPKNIGEGLTYLGESIGDTIGDMRLRQAEKAQGAADAGRIAALEALQRGGAPVPQPPVTSAPPVAPRPPPVSAPPRAAPAPRQAPAAVVPPPSPPPPPPPSARQFGPPVGELTQGYVELPGPSAAGITSGVPPSDFAEGGLLSPAPLAAPGLDPVFPEGGAAVAASNLPSSGYLPPAATAAAPPSSPPPPVAATPAEPINFMDYETTEWPVGTAGRPSAPAASPELLRAQEFQRSQGRPVTGPAGQPQTAPAGGLPSGPDRGDAPGSILGPQSALDRFIAKQEGFRPTAYWDYKQYSIGHGTRGRPGETISREEAGQRLQSEIANARQSVDDFAPDAPPGVKDALTSLTFNAGSGWQQSGLGRMIREGRYDEARDRFQQYIKAGGTPLPGLASRRQAELANFWDQPAGGGGSPVSTEGIRLAAYAPPDQVGGRLSGGAGGAPIPGLGGTGAIRMRGSQLSPDEQVTPSDIEPMPSTVQFGGAERFVRTDAPRPGIPPAAPVPGAAPLPPVAPPSATAGPQAPAAAPRPPDRVEGRPSQEPIPPAQEQEMPDPGPPPTRPAPRPYTPEQRRALEIARDPNAGPPAQAAAQQVFGEFEDARKRQEQLDISDYTNQRTKWEQDVTAKMKFDRERHERLIEQQTKRLGLEKTVSDLEKARYEAGTPRQQAEIDKALDIAKKQRDLFAEETVTAGGTQFRRPYTGPGALGPGGMPTGVPGGAPPKFEVPAGLPAPKDEPLTEAQQSGFLFAMRVRPDLDRIDTQYAKGKILTDPKQVALEMLPGGNALVSDEYRTTRDSLGNWGAGFLNKVSGLAVTPSEATRQLPAFIPRVGDTQQQLDEKSTRRRDFTNAVEKISTPGGLKELKTMMDKTNEAYNLDVKMRDWAEKNPDDPRAKDIKNRLGIK